MRYVICECVSYFDEAFDGSLCKVSKVLQVCDTKEKAEGLLNIFDPMRYGDFDTIVRVVTEDMLDKSFR